ncbi:MAG: hypothetical protein KAQ94_09705 [Arcobacteraceae bacterium]|nr:hypothetical protein [Arcobacteraceae bacterium]
MKNIILTFLMITISSYAKQDFYYSFINEDKSQIAEFKKQEILTGNHKLQTIKRLIREGQLENAYNQMVKFKEKNKLKILNSGIILLYSEILYKRGGTKFSKEAIALLENGINNSKIQREDLLDAYKLLVVLNLNINKPKEAKYYANSISKIFDDPVAKSFGKITLSQIAIHKRQYKKAIDVLYEILVKTKNLSVATVVADELYDAYILAGEDEKAYDLAGKVLKKNINYYANDSFLALKKVDKLIDANMPNFAIDILKMLLNNAVEEESVNKFKFRLANVYMKIAGRNTFYMTLAKELYKDLMVQKNKTPYYSQVKISMDEILMREGKLEPSKILTKYSESEVMEQKVLLQELLNSHKQKDYESIRKLKHIYRKIATTITQRFGYKNIDELFDIINADMIRFYLENEKCIELSQVLHLVRDEALQVLIENNTSRTQLFDCLTEIPDERSYNMAKSSFKRHKDASLYLSLEKVAILLNKIDDAYEFIQKIDMNNDSKIKEEEFLYRFLVYGKLNNASSMEQFFRYTNKHPEYIEANEDNPLIIDFYYQYYLYLQKNNDENEAQIILNKLYKKQQDMKAFVYSPFVDLELVKEAKLDDDYETALNYLDMVIKQTRKLSDNNLANIYYEMARVYEYLGKENRYKKSIQKCKSLKDADNFYKKMCDRL